MKIALQITSTITKILNFHYKLNHLLRVTHTVSYSFMSQEINMNWLHHKHKSKRNPATSGFEIKDKIP